MDARQKAGAALIGVALLFVVAAFGLWAWENSDTQETERETDALTAAMSGGTYDEAEPDPTGSYVLGAFGAVLFVSGVILVAVSPRATPDVSDRP